MGKAKVRDVCIEFLEALLCITAGRFGRCVGFEVHPNSALSSKEDRGRPLRSSLEAVLS